MTDHRVDGPAWSVPLGCAALTAAMVLLSLSSAGVTRAVGDDTPSWTDTGLGGTGLLLSIRQQLTGHYDREMTRLQGDKERLRARLQGAAEADKQTIQGQIADINRQQREAAQLKARVDDGTAINDLFTGLTTARDVGKWTVEQLDSGGSYSRDQAVIPAELVAGLMREGSGTGPSGWAELSQRLRTGVATAGRINDIIDKTTKLAVAYEEASRLDWTPEGRNAARGLKLIATFLTEYGPMLDNKALGQLIKYYGVAADSAHKKLVKLDGAIKKRTAGMLIPGMTNEEGRRASRLQDETGIDPLGQLIARVPGLRDVYTVGDPNNPSEILLWDGLKWVKASDVERGLTLDELRRRYAFFAAHGNLNPTVQEVLRDYERAVGIRLTADKAYVEPGGQVRLQVSAARGDGWRSPPGMVKLEAAKAGYLTTGGTGSFTPSILEQDQGEREAVWTAPDNENEEYILSAKWMETGEPQAGKAEVRIRTGYKTMVTVTCEPPKLEVGGDDGIVSYEVRSADGEYLSEGDLEITIRSKPPLLQIGRHLRSTTGKSAGSAVISSDGIPGKYEVIVQFPGRRGGVLSSHAAASEGRATVELVEKKEEVVQRQGTSGEGERRLGLQRSIAFLVDCSGSMGGQKLKDAKAAVKDAARETNDGKTQWALLGYGGHDVWEELAFTTDPAELGRAADGLGAGGDTPLTYALYKAVAYVRTNGKTPEGRVVVLCDGQDNCPERKSVSREEAMDKLQKLLHDVNSPIPDPLEMRGDQ